MENFIAPEKAPLVAAQVCLRAVSGLLIGKRDLTMVVMVGGEQVYIDTMRETLIGTVAPAGPV
jgi:hypothetical protein